MVSWCRVRGIHCRDFLRVQKFGGRPSSGMVVKVSSSPDAALCIRCPGLWITSGRASRSSGMASSTCEGRREFGVLMALGASSPRHSRLPSMSTTYLRSIKSRRKGAYLGRLVAVSVILTCKATKSISIIFLDISSALAAKDLSTTRRAR